MQVTVHGAELTDKEIGAYIDHGLEKYGAIKGLTITVDGDYVDLDYDLGKRPFERIRRITGYLAGTVDRFNDAKRAEVRDRLKHGGINDVQDQD